jgi:hypothetical protein
VEAEVNDLFSQMCDCCAKRGSVYEAGCGLCVARRTARSPQKVRRVIYAEVQREQGTPAMEAFKALVKSEWELDRGVEKT